MVLDNFTPRMIRALLPQAPLGANLILGIFAFACAALA